MKYDFNVFNFNYNETEKNKIRKFLVKGFCYAIYLPYLPFVFLIILISPFIKIRIAFIDSERIGEYVSQINNYLMHKTFLKKNFIKEKKTLDLFFRSKSIANKIVYSKLVSPNLKILSRFILFPIYKWFLLIKSNHALNLKKLVNDDFQFNQKYSSNINLSHNEIFLGDEFLKSINYPINSRIVLIVGRDSKYLETVFKTNDYSFNNIRNVDIKTFKKSINYLLENNFYVIRMGSIVKEELKIKSKNFFDYASSQVKSEFLDLYLFYKCEFVLSVSSGIDELAKVFKKPICYVNFLPIADFKLNWKSLTILKKIFDRNKGEYIPYSDLYLKNLQKCFNGNDYEDQDISLVDNTDEEIYYCLKEFIENIIENKSNKYIDSKIQLYFRNLYLSGTKLEKNQGFISEVFFKKNQKLFE